MVVLPMQRCSSGSVTREVKIELQVTPQYQRHSMHGAMRSRGSTDGSRMVGFGSGFGVQIRFFSRVWIWIGFGPARFGFGSVPPGQVWIRIGSAGLGSDSDQIRLCRFGFGSDTGLVQILHPNPGLRVRTSFYGNRV